MEGNKVMFVREALLNIMDDFRGSISMSDACSISLGIFLIVSRGDNILKTEEMEDLLNSGPSETKERLVYISKRMEQNFEYKKIFTEYCFSRIEMVPDNVIIKCLNLFKRLQSEFGQEDDLASLVFRYITQKDQSEISRYKTPENINYLLSELLDVEDGHEINDPFMGLSGSLSMIDKLHKELELKFSGSDTNASMYYLSKINMILSNIKESHLRKEDIMLNPVLDEQGMLKKYDRIVCEPPLVFKHEMYEKIISDNYGRFKYGNPGRGINDWLILQHIISTLKYDGKAAVITSKGPLLRSNEAKIRGIIVEHDLIECIIDLPAGMLSSTNIPIAILVFNNNKPVRRQNKILLIDATALVVRKHKSNVVLPPESLKKIIKAYHDDEDVEGLSKYVTIDEIKGFGYNLNLGDKLKAQEINDTLKNSVELKDKVVEIFRGVQIPLNTLDDAKKSENKTHYLLNLSNIIDGMIKINNDSYIEAQVKWTKSYSVKPGDLVASSRGPFKCAVVEADLPPAIISGNLLVIRLKRDCDPYVLKFFLDSPLGMKMILSIQTGTTSTIINPNNLNSLLIPDTDMKKQKEISNAIVEFQKTYRKMVLEAEEYKKKQIADIYSQIVIK